MKTLKNKGFTKTELIIVIAIVAVLAATLIPTFVSLAKNKTAQEQTNQQLADLAEKVENQQTLTIEDIKAQIAAQIAGIQLPEGIDADDVNKAIADAIAGIKIPEAGLSKDQVQTIIDNAIKNIKLPEAGLSAADVEKIVTDAIAGIKLPEGGLSADEIKQIVNDAIKGAGSSLSAKDVQKIIDAAIAGLKLPENVLSAAEVEKIIADAIAGIKIPEVGPTAADVEKMINDAIAATLQNIKPGVTDAELKAAIEAAIKEALAQLEGTYLTDEQIQELIDKALAGLKPEETEPEETDPAAPVATTVTLNPTYLQLNVGTAGQISATVFDQYGNVMPNAVVRWSTTNSICAYIHMGTVYGIASGTAVVTATVEGTDVSANCYVVVGDGSIMPPAPQNVPVTSVALNTNTATIEVGDKATLTAVVLPATATNKAVTWTSSNTAVATVKNGVVTAVKEGTAVITVTTVDGAKTATCVVTVVAGDGSVKVNNATDLMAALAAGSKVKLTANVSVAGDYSIPANCASTLDLNGFTLTENGEWEIHGDLTIKNGSIIIERPEDENSIYMHSGFSVEATGSLSLDNVDIVGDRLWNIENKGTLYLANSVFTVDGGYGIGNSGSAVIINSTMIANGEATSQIYSIGGTVNVANTDFIEGPDFVSYYYAAPIEAHKNSVITLDAVNVITSADEYSVFAASDAEVVIKSGTFNTKLMCIPYATITIYDGSINGIAYNSITAESDIFIGAGCELIKGDNCWIIGTVEPTVPAPVPVTGITLNKETVALNDGDQVTLIATVLPSNATNKGVIWSSSNTTVATVNDGKVTAVGNGTATITVTTLDGTFTATCQVTVTTRVTGVTLNKTELTLLVGKTYTLTAKTVPTTASNKTFIWTSSNEAVATVTSKGLVRAISKGTAIITVTTKDGGFTATCTVTVSDIAVTSVSLNSSSRSVYVGKTAQLIATVYPTNAANQAVIWSSSNEAVATVDKNGLVTGISAGTATITVTTVDGGFTATCNVTVRVQTVSVSSVKLDKKTADLIVGDTVTLTATVLPEDATNKAVRWTSSNRNVATVDENGVVTAVAPGSTIITVTTNNNGRTATCLVTVKANEDGFVEVNDATDFIDALKSGKNIRLTANVSAVGDEIFAPANDIILDLNGKTLTEQGEWKIYCDFTVKNGTIIVEKPDNAQDVYQKSGLCVETGTLTLENVDIIGKRLWNIENSSTLYLTDSTITVDGGYGVATSGNTVITNCTIIANGEATSQIYCVGGTVTVKDSELVEGANFVSYYYMGAIEAHYDSSVTLDNVTVTTSADEHGVFAAGNSEVEIKRGSNFNTKLVCIPQATITIYDGTINGIAYDSITTGSEIFIGAGCKLTQGNNCWIIAE